MHSFTESEKENAWIFLENFTCINGLEKDWWVWNNDEIFAPYHYRIHIIDKIRKKYTPEEFYQYEKIINSMYWNLRNVLKEYVDDNVTSYSVTDEPNETNRSTVNSYVHFNQTDNKWYELKKLSDLDEKSMSIMMDRKLYDLYMDDPKMIKDFVNPLIFYYYKNYPFPNANPMFYNNNQESYWLKKINKMYYFDSLKGQENEFGESWRRLIR